MDLIPACPARFSLEFGGSRAWRDEGGVVASPSHGARSGAVRGKRGSGEVSSSPGRTAKSAPTDARPSSTRSTQAFRNAAIPAGPVSRESRIRSFPAKRSPSATRALMGSTIWAWWFRAIVRPNRDRAVAPREEYRKRAGDREARRDVRQLLGDVLARALQTPRQSVHRPPGLRTVASRGRCPGKGRCRGADFGARVRGAGVGGTSASPRANSSNSERTPTHGHGSKRARHPRGSACSRITSWSRRPQRRSASGLSPIRRICFADFW